MYNIVEMEAFMGKEREVTILDINEEEFVNKLLKNGAVKQDEFLQRRYTYDFNPVKKNKWIRLRTNGKKTTLTIKEIKDKSAIDGTMELETVVDDFDVMNDILNELGYHYRNYQENYRKIYLMDNVEISIDSWPLIPTYAEVEGKSNEDVIKALNKLGYTLNDVTTLDVTSIYNEIYNIDLLKIKELKFEGSNHESMLEYNK